MVRRVFKLSETHRLKSITLHYSFSETNHCSERKDRKTKNIKVETPESQIWSRFSTNFGISAKIFEVSLNGMVTGKVYILVIFFGDFNNRVKLCATLVIKQI